MKKCLFFQNKNKYVFRIMWYLCEKRCWKGGIRRLDAKQLRKLRRSNHFELLVEQAKETEELQGEVKELEGKLERRELEVIDAG